MSSGPRPFTVRAGSILNAFRRATAVVRLTPFDRSTPGGRSRERYRRIALSTASAFASRGVGIVANLVTVPIVLAQLGRTQYGLWAAISSLTAWVTLFDFGVINGLVNALAQAHGADDRAAASRSVSTALALLLVVAAVLGAAAAIALPSVDWSGLFAARGVATDSDVRWAVAAAFIPVIVGLPLSVVRQIYAGYQQAYVGNLFAALGSALTLIGTVAAVHSGAGLPTLVAVVGAATTAAAALNFAYLFAHQMPWLRPQRALISRAAAVRLMRVSGPLFLFQVGALVVNETQLLILSHRTSLATVGDYAVVNRLYMVLGSFMALSTAAFVPTFREAAERGEYAWVRRSFRRMVTLRLLVAVGFASAVLLGGNVFLRFWLRGAAVQFGPDVWGALAVLIVSATWVTAFTDLLTVLDRVWIPVALVTVNGIVTALLTYWLAPTYGVAGTIASVACVTVLVSSWLVPLLTRPVFAEKTDGIPAHPAHNA